MSVHDSCAKRHDGRLSDQMRCINFEYNAFGYSAGSVLFELGETKVLCSITLQNTVPSFLRGKKTGWLTAEYAMLPTATSLRTARENSADKRSGRSIEISRMIGRVLRAAVCLDALGERTIQVDCDVLQADGSTRTACITASFLALRKAVSKWLASGVIEKDIIIHEIAAVSVGVIAGNVVLDMDYKEDGNAQADFNVVLTRSGDIVELQGAAEQQPVSWQQFDRMRVLAQAGVAQLFDAVAATQQKLADKHTTTNSKVPFFGLQNRLASQQKSES